jgi:hypothetical protein
MGRKSLTKEEVNERLVDRGIIMTGEYISNSTKTEFRCSENHIWDTRPRTVLSGKGCPSCSRTGITGRPSLSKDIIDDRLLERRITMIGKYNGTSSKETFRCSEDHEWSATLNNVLSGRGCPKCAKYGFDDDEPGWGYALDFGTYIKFGITNDLERRLNEHLNNGNYKVAATRLHEIGKYARDWEKIIKTTFGGRFVTKEVCPDGYTETLCVSKLDDLLETMV